MKLTDTTYIYVIGMPCVQAVKVGWTSDVTERLAGLQTASPFPLVVLWQQPIPDAQAVEAALHKQFRDKCVRGEWFDLGPDAARIVREACERIVGPLSASIPVFTDESPDGDRLPKLKTQELAFRDAARWAATLEDPPREVSVAELVRHVRAFTDGQGTRLWGKLSDRRMAEIILKAYRQCSAAEHLRVRGDLIPVGLIKGIRQSMQAQASIDSRLGPHFDGLAETAVANLAKTRRSRAEVSP